MSLLSCEFVFYATAAVNCAVPLPSGSPFPATRTYPVDYLVGFRIYIVGFYRLQGALGLTALTGA